MTAAKQSQQEKPDIYQHHDYRDYLETWVDWNKQNTPRFSLRKLSSECGFSPSYVSLVLSGQRNLSPKATDKLVNAMGLDPSEKSYFKWLRNLAESSAQEDRLKALQQILRFRNYKSLNPKEFEIFKYLTKWYYVAIRELAATSGFKNDPKWIQKKLNKHVPVSQIEKALEFLFENDFLVKNDDGTITYPSKKLECTGGVFQIALAQFHREMLDLASESIDRVKKEERNLTGYTFAIPKESFGKVKEILEEAEKQIAALETSEAKKSDTVYHVGFTAFPLTEETNEK
jgi:uncharacterized protein (TIGR02147 family)